MCGVSKMMPPGSVQCLLVLFFINVIEYGLDIETGVDVVTAQGMLTHLLVALAGLLTRRRIKRAATAQPEARPAQCGTGGISPTWSVSIQDSGRPGPGERPPARRREIAPAELPLGPPPVGFHTNADQGVAGAPA